MSFESMTEFLRQKPHWIFLMAEHPTQSCDQNFRSAPIAVTLMALMPPNASEDINNLIAAAR